MANSSRALQCVLGAAWRRAAQYCEVSAAAHHSETGAECPAIGVPPLATLNSWIPRQLPRAGTSCCQHQSKTIFSRASLRSQNASSCGIGFSPVHPWVHIVSTRE